MRLRLGLLAVSLFAALLAPSLARANGASIPDTAEFHPQSPAPGDLAMNTTFGFLFSSDDGAHWGWTCHEAIIGTVSYTPRTYRSPNGVMFVGVPLGLAVQPSQALWRTTNHGCDWTPVATLVSNAVLALSFDPSGTRAIAAGTDKTVTNGLAWLSTDGGATFGAPLLSHGGQLFTSALIAPSDPQRLYVSALQPSPQAASVYRSDNGGASWTEYPFLAGVDNATRLLAVSPTNADLVWLRHDTPMDRVLVSTNGAVSFREILVVQGDVTGFTLTDGGNRVWVAARTTGGLFSSIGGAPFVQLPGAPSPRCLSSLGNEVFACANPYADDFAAGRTMDGVTWTTAMSFARVGGPIACSTGSTSATVCDPLWPGIDQKIHGTSPTPTPTPTPPAKKKPEDCRCSLGGSAPGFLPVTLALIALVARRTRRSAR